MPSVWIKSLEQSGHRGRGHLLLLLLLLALHFLLARPPGVGPRSTSPLARVYVEIRGHVKRPGVYGFPSRPNLRELIVRSGGLVPREVSGAPSLAGVLGTGSCVQVRITPGGEVHLFQGRMSAFYKVTLGIPVSLNQESAEGLTAIPGIGPSLAERIVRQRNRVGPFHSLKELLSVQGIGPLLYRKIRPYLEL